MNRDNIKKNQLKTQHMKKAFIITQSKEHFESLHSFLVSIGYTNNQPWEEMETNINTLKSIDIKWPTSNQMLDKMSDDSIHKIMMMLAGNELRNRKEFSDLFIIEDNPSSSVRLESEKFFACFQHVAYYLNGQNTKCSVIYLISTRRTEEVVLHSENAYIWLEFGDSTNLERVSEKFKNTINTFIDRNNPKTLSGWLSQNF